MARCENIILENLPYGFKHLKSKEQVLTVQAVQLVILLLQVLMLRDSDLFEEYKTPIGGSVDIVCKDNHKKLTVDEWDLDPHDMKMTVRCLPTFRYDLPRENFPKVKTFSSTSVFLKTFNQSIAVSELLPGAEVTVEPDYHERVRPVHRQ